MHIKGVTYSIKKVRCVLLQHSAPLMFWNSCYVDLNIEYRNLQNFKNFRHANINFTNRTLHGACISNERKYYYTKISNVK